MRSGSYARHSFQASSCCASQCPALCMGATLSAAVWGVHTPYPKRQRSQACSASRAIQMDWPRDPEARSRLSLLDIYSTECLEEIVAAQDAQGKAALRSTCSTFRRLANDATTKLKLTPDNCARGIAPALKARFTKVTELDLNGFLGEPTVVLRKLPAMIGAPWDAITTLTISNGLDHKAAAPLAAGLTCVTTLSIKGHDFTPRKFGVPLIRSVCSKLPLLTHMDTSISAPLSGAAFRFTPALVHLNAPVDCSTQDLNSLWTLTKLTSLQLALKRVSAAPGAWLTGLSALRDLNSLKIATRNTNPPQWPPNGCGITNGIRTLPALTQLVAPSLPPPPNNVPIFFPALQEVELLNLDSNTLRMLALGCKGLVTLRGKSFDMNFGQTQNTPLRRVTQLVLKDDPSVNASHVRLVRALPALQVLDVKLAHPKVLVGMNSLKQVSCIGGVTQLQSLHLLPALDTLKLHDHPIDCYAFMINLVKLTSLEAHFIFPPEKCTMAALYKWLNAMSLLTRLHTLTLDLGWFNVEQHTYTNDQALAVFEMLADMPSLEVLSWTGNVYTTTTAHHYAVMTDERLATISTSKSLREITLIKEPLVTAEACTALMARRPAGRPLKIITKAAAA